MWRLTASLSILFALAALLAACGGSAASLTDDPRLEVYDDGLTTDGQEHLPPTVTVPYPTVPPYGGPHHIIPTPCGVLSATPRFENVVHALEHGAVVFWYSPHELGEEAVRRLTEIAVDLLTDGRYIIVAPYGALGHPLVLVSWGVRMPLAALEEDTVLAYVDSFHDDAPEPLAAGGCQSAL